MPAEDTEIVISQMGLMWLYNCLGDFTAKSYIDLSKNSHGTRVGLYGNYPMTLVRVTRGDCLNHCCLAIVEGKIQKQGKLYTSCLQLVLF